MSRIITLCVVLLCFFLSSIRTQSITDAILCEPSKNLTLTGLSNRGTVLSNLRNRSSLGSYSNATAGLSPNTIYGMFLCIGDINRASCSNCVQTATLRIAESCNSRGGFAIYYAECIVRYSNFYFFTLLEGPYLSNIYSPMDPSDSAELFNQTLPGKLEEFFLRASSSSPIPYFVEGKERVTHLEGSYDLAAMVQCSPDLDPRNCTLCLRLTVEDFFDRHDFFDVRSAISAQIFAPKCLVKYNISSLQTSLGVTKGNEISGRMFIAIMTALVLALMGL